MTQLQRTLAALEGNPRRTLMVGFASILLIVLIDWLVLSNVSLGYLHVIPIVLMATVLRIRQILVLSVLCAFLREYFSPFAFESGYSTRVAVVSAVLVTAGILTSQVNFNRKMLAAASEHLRVLVDTCPLGILVADGAGKLVLANERARSFFNLDDNFRRELIGRYIPPLETALLQSSGMTGLRTELECRARRHNGEEFLAHVWFSRWNSGEDTRLQAVVWDASVEVADREAGTLRALTMTSQVLVAAFAHEVRNLAGAARKLVEVMDRRSDEANRQSLSALSEVMESLEKLGSARLTQDPPGRPPLVDLRTVLEHAHTLTEDLLSGSGIELEWNVPAQVGKARAEPSALLQVFLNIVNNACEALDGTPAPQLSVLAQVAKDKVTVRLRNSGPGVSHPEHLFRAFQPDAQGTGLGLYISRALVRSFGGDLYYEAPPAGPVFVIELPAEGAVG